MIKSFNADERAALLLVKGVGPTVIARLEAMGFHTLAQLVAADMMTIVSMGAAMTGSSCWKNSPQARSAVQGAIDKAIQQAKVQATHAAKALQ